MIEALKDKNYITSLTAYSDDTRAKKELLILMCMPKDHWMIKALKETKSTKCHFFLTIFSVFQTRKWPGYLLVREKLTWNLMFKYYGLLLRIVIWYLVISFTKFLVSKSRRPEIVHCPKNPRLSDIWENFNAFWK